LEFWFCKKKRIFRDFREYVLDKGDCKKRRIFIDRGGKILFVAHTDTVHKPALLGRIKDRVFATGGDDRLGCYLAYTLSEKLGADLLLTDNEETGQTTAQHHNCKDYNWIVEFDRAGTDVVSYDMDNKEFLAELGKHWKIGIGSFTDITMLDTEACCFNLGIGYYDAHGSFSYFIPAEMDLQVQKFLKFYEKNKDIKYVQDFKPRQDFGFNRQSYGTGYDICDYCGQETRWEDLKEVFGYYACKDCRANGIVGGEIIRDSKYETCDYCGNTVPSGDIVSVGEYTVCRDCVPELKFELYGENFDRGRP
jgi:hypothetical protein